MFSRSAVYSEYNQAEIMTQDLINLLGQYYYNEKSKAILLKLSAIDKPLIHNPDTEDFK